MTEPVRLADYRRSCGRVVFDRRELRRLFAVYSARVASGDWRDYAIDLSPRMAAFAVFRSARDWPLFVIGKLAADRRGGRYFVARGGARLSQGHSLDAVLQVLEQPA